MSEPLLFCLDVADCCLSSLVCSLERSFQCYCCCWCTVSTWSPLISQIIVSPGLVGVSDLKKKKEDASLRMTLALVWGVSLGNHWSESALLLVLWVPWNTLLNWWWWWWCTETRRQRGTLRQCHTQADTAFFHYFELCFLCEPSRVKWSVERMLANECSLLLCCFTQYFTFFFFVSVSKSMNAFSSK